MRRSNIASIGPDGGGNRREVARRGPRRGLAAGAGVALFLVAGSAWSATPDEELSKCTDDYFAANGGTFTCTVCGISAGCTGSDCHWGSLKANVDTDGIGAMASAGYQLYCLNSGGTMVATASPVTTQSAALNRAMGRDGRGAGARQLGGAVEYGSRSGGSASYGIAVPFNFTSPMGDGDTSLDLTGTALYGHSDQLSQYGVTAAPLLRTSPLDDGETSAVYGVSVPVQLIVTTGTSINTSFVYHAGLGGIAGISSASGTGIGAAVDAMYAGGVQVPFQVVGRMPLGDTSLVVQPGISAEATAGGSVLDTLQQNVMVGWDIGEWLVGLRVFRQGDKAWVFSLGAAEATKASRLAAGTDDAYKRGEAHAPVAPLPAGARSKAIVVAEVTDSSVDSASLAEAIGAVLAESDIHVAPPQAAPASGATPASGAMDPPRLDADRAGAQALLAVNVVATPTDAGSLQLSILVVGRGFVARRTMLVERPELEASTTAALRALLAKVDFSALKEAPLPPAEAYPPPEATPPAPPAPPAPQPGSDAVPAPEPMPTPPSGTTPPVSGCVRDTECKGDRICEHGRCVAPHE